MSDATASCVTAALSLQTTDQVDTLPPPWLAEAPLIAQLWRTTGLPDACSQNPQSFQP